MFDAARVLGSAIRRVYERDAEALKNADVDFNVSLVFGGQIRGEGMRLFQMYSAGNFIEATNETPYFQVGESKYGKPVLDRVLTPDTPLAEAAKCVLVSMDSTMKSNLSVGLPLDLVVYEADSFKKRQDRLHRQQQPLLQDDAQQLGPKTARGVRQHRRPGLGRRAHRHAAEDARPRATNR
jgi:predicted proteasome-type protease